MNSLRILIVEDEILIAEDLKDSLFSLGCKNVEMAHDKSTALQYIEKFKPDLILLDIRMENETDGLEIGSYISKNSGNPFIYITAHSDVAMVKEIIKTNPAGYITKPVRKSDLFASIGLAMNRVNFSQSAKTLKIKDGYSTVMIETDSIFYVEAEGNYLNIFCENKKYVSRQSLDSLIDEINSSSFYRIHRSFLVNTKKIEKFSRREVIVNDIKLPVSRNIGVEFENFMKTA